MGPEAVEVPMEPMPDLTAMRESKGIDLKVLSNTTKIRASYLEAIEKGEFHKLPEPIYTEMFIKTYAHELGIDPGIMLSRYRQHVEKKEEPVRQAGEQKKRFELPRININMPSVRTVGWVVSLVIVVAFLISFFSSYMEKKADFQQPLPDVKSTVAQSSDQQNATDQAQTPNAQTTPGDPSVQAKEGATPAAVQPAAPAAPARTSYKLAIEASETSWLNIMEDDNPPYEILLRPGERIEREASEKFTVDIGNAGGVSVYFQGKSLGSLGKSGQVVHLNLPSED